MSRWRTASLVACALVVPVAAGTEGTEPEAVVLGGPEVFRVDWNTRSLLAHDLDGDGRLDLALINNGRAAIEILYQRRPGEVRKERTRRSAKRWRPELEDGRFQRETLVVGHSANSLAAGDLDGDGRADLAYTGGPAGLTVRFQHRKGDWSETATFESVYPGRWSSALAIADLTGDGAPELVALGAEELVILSRDGRGGLGTPRRYPLAEGDAYGLLARDLNGDGLPDLSYLVPESDWAWRARYQRPDGSFGPERAFRLTTPRGLLHPLGGGGEGESGFATIGSLTGMVERLALAAPRKGVSDRNLHPRVYRTPTDENGSQSYALGDLDGDGRLDLALADRGGSQVWLYFQREDGTLSEATAFPALSDVASISAGDVDGDGAAELFLASPGEGALGLSRLSTEGRLLYPVSLPAAGRPLACTAADLDGDGAVELSYVLAEEGVRAVVVLAVGNDGEWSEVQRVPLEGLRTDPSALEALDADQDGRTDLAIFTVRSPMRLLLQDEEGRLRDVSGAEGYRDGLVDNLLPADLGQGDLDGDGRPEMLVGAKGFARALRVDSEGTLTVVDQFNARDGEVQVVAPLATDLDGDGVLEILLGERGGDELELLKRDPSGVFRFERSLPVGPIELVASRVVDLDGSGGDDLLYFGRDRFWQVPVEGADLELRTLASLEPEIEEMSYTGLEVGDLNGDGIEELVVVDATETRILEILGRSEEGGWSSLLHFPVFEESPGFEGRRGGSREPRQVLVADLDGNGRSDVTLLVHDRVLVYPSETQD